MDLPTVELVSGAFYWIKPAYDAEDRWTVARWEHGCFWDPKNNEVAPRVISGPIQSPASDDVGSSQLTRDA